MNEEQDREHDDRERTWKEEFSVAGREVVDRVKRLIREGNVRKIIIRKADGSVLREITLTQGVAIGGALAFVAPALAAIGAVVALMSRVKIEVIRDRSAAESAEQDDWPREEDEP